MAGRDWVDDMGDTRGHGYLLVFGNKIGGSI